LQPLETATLNEWFETPKGAYVLGWERAQFDSAVEDVFGYNALQIGLPGIDFLRANRIALRVTAGLAPGCGLRADPNHLPLASQSMDRRCPTCSSSIRIRTRSSIWPSYPAPEGQIVIAGFNR
jgi:hypothetical protein